VTYAVKVNDLNSHRCDSSISNRFPPSAGFIQGYHLTHHKRTVHGLDVKSHIRRVEKFVAPSSTNQLEEDEAQLAAVAEDVKHEEVQVRSRQAFGSQIL
jgi:hypothetical protein